MTHTADECPIKEISEKHIKFVTQTEQLIEPIVFRDYAFKDEDYITSVLKLPRPKAPADVNKFLGWSISPTENLIWDENAMMLENLFKLDENPDTDWDEVEQLIQSTGEIPDAFAEAFFESFTSMTLYAVWSNNVRVTFETGSGGSAVMSQFLPKGTRAIRPKDPTKTFAVSFLGWYTSQDYTEEWDFNTPVDKDMTLYAYFLEVGIDNPVPGATETVLGDPNARLRASDFGITAGANGYRVSLYGDDNELLSPDELTAVLSHDEPVSYNSKNVNSWVLGLFKAYVHVSNGIAVSIIINAPYANAPNIVIPTYINNIPVVIQNGAFKNCNHIENVMIFGPATTISPGVSAFEGCQNLRAVNMEYSAYTEIDAGAFKNCPSLVSVVLPKSVKTIRGSAFSGCTSLDRVTFGHGIITVEDNAFSGCTSITRVKASASMESVRVGSVFSSCPSFTDFEYAENTAVLFSLAGVTGIKEVIVPSGVKEIPANTFSDCTGLESISLAEGLLSIGSNAFKNCIALTEIEIPASVTSYFNEYRIVYGSAYYNKNVFYGCKNLKKLTFGGDISILNEHIFVEMRNLETVVLREGVTTIESGVFEGRSWLKTVVLPSSLQTIGRYAFYYCQELSSVGVQGAVGAELPEGVESIGDRAFYGCVSLTQLKMPSTVTVIDTNAFYSCTGLSKAVLNKGLLTIGSKAFAGCTLLTEIEIPESVTSYYSNNYDDNVFYGCTNLKKLTFGGDISTIKNRIFYELSKSLETVVLREGVTTLESGAFSHMAKLKTVVLPTSLKTIGGGSFEQCHALSSVGVKDAVGVQLPEGVESIVNYAFYYCRSLKQIKLPSTVTYIGYYTFQDCTGLSKVVLNEGLQTIGMNAFENCTSLTEIEIPESVTSYYYSGRGSGNNTCYENVFFGCTNLKKLTFGGDISAINRYMFYELRNSLETLVLREGVTRLNDYAFYDMSKLRTVVLPTSLQTIGSVAFSRCSSLTSVGVKGAVGMELPEGVESVGGGAFSNCVSLTQIKLPSTVTYIDADAFYSCTGLSKVVLNNGLLAISHNAFRDCTSLTEIEIPESVTYYYDRYEGSGEYACSNNVFYGCSSLKKITFGGDTSAIGKYMFYELRNCLETVVLREGVTELASNAFRDMTKLKTVVLPTSLQTIGSYAFYGCSALESLYHGGGIQTIGSNALPKNGLLKVYKLSSHIVSRDVTTDALYDYCAANGIPYLSGDDQVPFVTLSFVTGTDAVIDPITAAPGSMLTEPVPPSREGWIFTGWYEDEECALSWSFTEERMPVSDTTLHAGWRRKTDSGNALYAVEDGKATLLSYVLFEFDDTAVYLPETYMGAPVTAIAANAFAGQDITFLRLPSTLELLDPEALRGMDDLRMISISGANLNFACVGGNLYNKDVSALLRYAPGSPLTALTLPKTVTEIGAYAFESAGRLESVTFPDGLLSVGDAAFQYCDALETVELPDATEAIGDYAFASCPSLAYVATGDGLASVGSGAFAHCSRTLSLYGAVGGALSEYAAAFGLRFNRRAVSYMVYGSEVKKQLFTSGAPLARPVITLTDPLTFIEGWYTEPELENAWDFDTMTMPLADLTLYANVLDMFVTEQITEVTQGENGEDITTVIGLRVTGYNGAATDVTVPGVIGGYPVTAIAAGAFDAAIVTSLRLPDFITEIAPGALDGIEIFCHPGTATADTLAAAGLVAGQNIKWVLSFDARGGALIDAMELDETEAVSLPAPVRDGYSFAGWYTDSAMTQPAALDGDGLYTMPAADITLYASWTSAGGYIYDVNWAQLADGMHITGRAASKADITVPSHINGVPVIAIDEQAFMNDATLRSIELPETLVTIGDYAFSGSGLSVITVPEGVTSIGRFAFFGCKALSRVRLPSTLTALREYALSDCTALVTLTLPEGMTALERQALSGCVNLISLGLPSTLISIGAEALNGCAGLKTLSFGPALTRIDSTAFGGCANLTAFNVDAASDIFESADGVLYFKDKVGLVRYPCARAGEAYTVDTGAVSVEPYAFADCAKLTSISLPESVWTIGDHAFSGAVMLETVNIPENASLTTIPDYAFSRCASLASVAIPSNIRIIGASAFANCGVMAGMTIPETVLSIGGGAFSYGTVIYGRRGSYAETWAAAAGRVFIDPDEHIAVESVTLSGQELNLRPGDRHLLTGETAPENATDAALGWYSSNNNVALVDDGLIRALNCGTAIITAVTRDGAAASCVVTVKADVESIMQAESDIALEVGLGAALAYDLTPAYITDRTLIWESSDRAVVQCDRNGALFAVGEGEAVITATAADGGGAAASWQVSVSFPQSTFTMPAAMTTLGYQAFMNSTAFKVVRMGENMQAIASDVFKGCASLRCAIIPASVTMIGGDVFYGCSPDFAIICAEGSAAADYADANGHKKYIIPSGND